MKSVAFTINAVNTVHLHRNIKELNELMVFSIWNKNVMSKQNGVDVESPYTA